MITAKISSKNQIGVPKAVRQHLDVGKGDELVFEIKDDHIAVRALKPIDETKDDPFTLFDEWDSGFDRDAYADL